MSHAMLLRLFLSPYFNISVAMHYLKTYPDSIGISHYLCWRMKHMKADEVEFYWPQMCHLLITRPTQSNALESFVLERAEESTHSAILTFWFMQAALHDLSGTRAINPRPFLICQRILHKCHEIIFGDPPEPSSSPYKSLPTSPHASTHSFQGSPRKNILVVGRDRIRARAGSAFTARFTKRINPHFGPALVGMGVVLASAPGMPELAEVTGQVAITQGRAPMDDEEDTRSRVEIARDGGADGPRGGDDIPKIVTRQSGDTDESDEEPNHGLGMTSIPPSTLRSTGDTPDKKNSIRLNSPPRRPLNGKRSSSGTPGHDAGELRQTLTRNGSSLPRQHPAHTSPSLIQSAKLPTSSVTFSSSQSKRSSTPGPESDGQTGQRPTPLPRNLRQSGHSAFYSVPSLSTTGPSPRSNRMPFPSPESLLATYELDAQRQLLRAHYCRSEVRFLLTLEDIANRLLVIPKPARVSALRAELTSLNHKLPAECMPMWCPSDHSHEEGGETSDGQVLKSRLDRAWTSRPRGHHRVVRISPGDSVVLNSAEKAPYLIHVEILENDLDFDPEKRSNRELLKKIVTQEERKKRKRQGIEDEIPTPSTGWSFGSPMPEPLPRTPSTSNRSARKSSAQDGQRPRLGPRRQSSQSSQPTNGDVPEEVDLVEQLFGSNFSVRNEPPDLSDSIPLSLAPKNKQLDAMVWSRADGDSPALSRRPSSGSPGVTGESPRSYTPLPPNTAEGAVSPLVSPPLDGTSPSESLTTAVAPRRVITLDDYSERMRMAAIMLTQLNESVIATNAPPPSEGSSGGALKWIPGSGLITGSATPLPNDPSQKMQSGARGRLQWAEAAAIRERIMEEMMALEEERVQRMTDEPVGVVVQPDTSSTKIAEDESIIRRELNKADPSAAVFNESWAAKKSRIRAASPWGHLATWDVLSVIVKTGGDLRQEQLATQLIERFSKIWKEEGCECWVRFFRILITGDNSGLVETITDTISVHSIKKGEYARRLTEGNLGHVSLLDHYIRTYGEMDTGRFARAQRNFIKSLAGYSIVTYLLQIKDRHNGNILVDREGHLIHIDFGFMLSNSPGNMGFEAAPFKLPMEYVEIMGGLDSPGFLQFKRLFKEGFEAARKHSDSIITIVELMQKDSKLDCFMMFGEQTSQHLRERFQLGLTQAATDAYLERLIVSSIGSNWTRLYDSFQYYSQGVL